MAWKISLLQKLWKNWICSSPDSGKSTNLAGGVWKESQQMRVRSLPQRSSKRNVKLADFFLTLAAPEHQDMNGQVEVTWRTLRTVAHALMIHARVPEVYVHFALMYTTDHIFPVLPIKYLIKEDGDPTTPHKLSTSIKPSVSHLRVLFCPCVVRKATALVETKTLNMCHQAQKGFRGIFVGIPEHKKGYLVYVPITRKVISSYIVVFDKNFPSALSYTARPYSEAMAMRLAVMYTPYATSLKEQTGDVTTFAQFEKGNILTACMGLTSVTNVF